MGFSWSGEGINGTGSDTRLTVDAKVFSAGFVMINGCRRHNATQPYPWAKFTR
jgi:hypothetical protein